MTDEFNKGFRRGYDAALQNLNAFLELTGSIRDHTKEPDSNDTLSFLLTHPYGAEEETGIQEPLKPCAESHQGGHTTCGHCELFDPMTNYFRDGMYCVRVGTEVTHDTTACKDFVPREGKRKDEQE